LTQLGKHFGLFEEKKQDTSHTFNIINYSSSPLTLEKEEVGSLEHSAEVLEELPDLVITDYKEA
jgi:hypothetical protein